MLDGKVEHNIGCFPCTLSSNMIKYTRSHPCKVTNKMLSLLSYISNIGRLSVSPLEVHFRLEVTLFWWRKCSAHESISVTWSLNCYLFYLRNVMFRCCTTNKIPLINPYWIGLQFSMLAISCYLKNMVFTCVLQVYISWTFSWFDDFLICFPCRYASWGSVIALYLLG